MMASSTSKPLFKRLLRVLHKAWFRGQWCLAYKMSETEGMPDSFFDFQVVLPPKDRFWADPFVVERNGKYYIFFEDYRYKTRKGHISVSEMDAYGKVQPPITVLERPYHLSYPFIFEYQGNDYMIPETHENKTVELYRSVAFPYQWEMEKTLLTNISAADATLAEMDGRWWMFIAVRSFDVLSPHNDLHLFYSDNPLADWKPHRRNPVKSDVRSSRPAGKLFRWKDQLYRPAQDCSTAYGYAISINRIEQLTPDHFSEVEVSRIVPQWNKAIHRNHTINHSGRLTVIDCFQYRRRWGPI